MSGDWWTEPVVIVALIGLAGSIIGLVGAITGGVGGFFARAYFQSQKAPESAIRVIQGAMEGLQAENKRLRETLDCERREHASEVAVMKVEIAELRRRVDEYEKTVGELYAEIGRMKAGR